MNTTIKNTISTILTIGTINFWTLGFNELICLISSGILVTWSISILFLEEGWNDNETIEALERMCDAAEEMVDEQQYCKKCSSDLEWVECSFCGGEGGRGWEELQFEDPLWYSPDDFVICDHCGGKCGFERCINSECESNKTF